jgi:glycosyltransferase involved in cell wall biosynthesis
MNPHPFFAVVLATYGRGDHIRPTIASVLQQTCADFELIVVGDGCNDTTEEVVASFGDARIAWHNLERNTGSQSAPNNVGIRHASAPWICYIGHDDIWAPDHLDRARRAIAADDTLDFVIGGCILHGPQDSDVYFVTGRFERSDDALQHFFPPASIAHRCDVPQRIGEWRDARSLTAPVDCDFLLRAAQGGLRFASTGCVTVHKFAAGHRYLSYLRQDSAEQHAMLRALAEADGGRIERIVEASKRQGRFMAMRYPDFATLEKGRLFEQYRKAKGLSRPPLRPLPERRRIEQSGEPRALDWHDLEQGVRPFRWSGPNPRPKILIPFSGDRARIAINVVHVAPDARLGDVAVCCEDHRVDCFVEKDDENRQWLVFPAKLKPADETVVTLHTPRMFCPHELIGSGDQRKLGIAVADVVIDPL